MLGGVKAFRHGDGPRVIGLAELGPVRRREDHRVGVLRRLGDGPDFGLAVIGGLGQERRLRLFGQSLKVRPLLPGQRNHGVGPGKLGSQFFNRRLGSV